MTVKIKSLILGMVYYGNNCTVYKLWLTIATIIIVFV